MLITLSILMFIIILNNYNIAADGIFYDNCVIKNNMQRYFGRENENDSYLIIFLIKITCRFELLLISSNFIFLQSHHNCSHVSID